MIEKENIIGLKTFVVALRTEWPCLSKRYNSKRKSKTSNKALVCRSIESKSNSECLCADVPEPASLENGCECVTML